MKSVQSSAPGPRHTPKSRLLVCFSCGTGAPSSGSVRTAQVPVSPQWLRNGYGKPDFWFHVLEHTKDRKERCSKSDFLAKYT